jgi:hypothetical protein
MNKEVIKNIIIVSLILGAILGLLAPVPYVGLIMLLIALLFASPLVILYLIMSGKFDLTTTKDSIITGAIVGFSANITFSIAYSIIMVILSLVFHYSSNFFLTAMIINSPIWLTLIFIIFIGVLTATTNAFSAFATYYIINLIRDMYEKSHPNNNDKLM